MRLMGQGQIQIGLFVLCPSTTERFKKELLSLAEATKDN